MPDILLTHSFSIRYDPKQLKLGQPWLPLGTLYAAAVLRKGGFGFRFFDYTFCRAPEEIIPVLEAEKPAILVIYDDCFNYLSKMCLMHMREAAFRMIDAGKNAGSIIIVCSADANDQYKLYLDHGADFIILGEGEITLTELVSELQNHSDIEYNTIKGIAWKTANGIAINQPRPIISEPDSLPLPLYELADIEKYRQIWLHKNGFFTMNMVTTRGCPYQCIWCSKPVYGNQYNSRSPWQVTKEMEEVIHKYNPDEIWFADDIFGLKSGWIREFRRLINASRIKIPYTIQSRADLLSEEGQVIDLAGSGCRKVWLGIESGSQKILDAMHKGITLLQIETASRLLSKHGIAQAFFLQLGFPGETMEDIESTMNLITGLMPEDIGISITYPLPGSKLYDTVKQELQDKANWTDSDDLALLFKNRFSPAFYKALHRYMHKYYRFRQSVFYWRNMFVRLPVSFNQRLRRMVLIPYYLLFSIVNRNRVNRLKNEV